MGVLSAIFYGIIQGLTEFLPVSSSGHLAIFEAIGGENPEELIAFNILLHVGTLFAVCAAYYKTIISLIGAFFRMLGKLFHGHFKLADYDCDERFAILAIISTLFLIPAAFIDKLIASLSSSVIAVGVILIFNALMLFFSDRLSKKDCKEKGIGEAKVSDAIVIGGAQMLAVLPGLSRSGSTITAGLMRGLKREEAVRYSFILSIPAIIGAAVFELGDLSGSSLSTKEFFAYLAGAVAAGAVGFGAIKLLELISRKSNFRIFSYYCFALGTAAIIYALIAL